MPRTQLSAPDRAMKTGRRVNPAIDGPRDQTVCFMLSQGEKLDLDRLAFCQQITRSGILATIATEFVAATADSKRAKAAEARLLEYLAACRKAVAKRGELAMTAVPSTGEI